MNRLAVEFEDRLKSLFVLIRIDKMLTTLHRIERVINVSSISSTVRLRTCPKESRKRSVMAPAPAQERQARLIMERGDCRSE
jgi:hypothetical protein